MERDAYNSSPAPSVEGDRFGREDDPELREMYRSRLRYAGDIVIAVEDGEER